MRVCFQVSASTQSNRRDRNQTLRARVLAVTFRGIAAYGACKSDGAVLVSITGRCRASTQEISGFSYALGLYIAHLTRLQRVVELCLEDLLEHIRACLMQLEQSARKDLPGAKSDLSRGWKEHGPSGRQGAYLVFVIVATQQVPTKPAQK